jgi:NADH-quinone oxidoreductase subunit G
MIKLSERSKDNKWENFDDVVASLAVSYPVFSSLREQVPDADFRFFNEKIPRQNKRFSGRAAINAGISVSEAMPPADTDSPLGFSMEGYRGEPPSALISSYWSPGWNSSQSVFKYMEESGGHLKEGGDPGIKLFPDKNKFTDDNIRNIPDPFTPRPDELLIVTVHLVFGSEELSSKGEAISGRIPEPFIILNEKEIKRLGLIEFKKFILTINQVVINVKVSTDNTLPDGVAGLSCLSGRVPYVELPTWGKVLKPGID